MFKFNVQKCVKTLFVGVLFSVFCISPAFAQTTEEGPPKSGGFSLDDLDLQAKQEEAENLAREKADAQRVKDANLLQSQWAEKQTEMSKAYRQVRSYEIRNISSELKVKAWKRFLQVFAKNNPYAIKDEEERKYAKQQVLFWPAEKQRRLVVDRAGIVVDTATGQTWQKRPHEFKRNWNEAYSYCQKLSLGGFSDWILPREEVLAGVGKRNNIFDGFKRSEWYMSSSTSSRGSAMVVGNNRDKTTVHKKEKQMVRCVRGGQ